jgi:hypothetical protein
MYGFHHRAGADLPSWANVLKGHYWVIRVEARNKAKKRKHYRMVRAEKLRLVESGVCVSEVNAVCKYLVSMKQVNADRLKATFSTEIKQLSFDFYN